MVHRPVDMRSGSGGRGSPTLVDEARLSCGLFGRKLAIECEIQLQHIDTRLAKQTEVRPFREPADQEVYLVCRHPSSPGHARRLGACRLGAQVRVETAG